MDDAFRDAIWQVLHETWADDEPLPMHADAVLAMPEMEAMKKALRYLHDNGDPDFLWWFLRNNAPSVIDWVLGEEARRG